MVVLASVLWMTLPKRKPLARMHYGALLMSMPPLARTTPLLRRRALYQAGRQRDALRVYVDARQELVEQYGLEPGEGLRAMERMILAHDPAIRPPAPSPRVGGGELQRNAVVLLLEIVGPERENGAGGFLAEIETIVERHEGSFRSTGSNSMAWSRLSRPACSMQTASPR